tara:strand:+ start:1679 stop:2470 length:792 start_codon:yes stop_codon:yes gene_type:complete
MKKTFDLSDVKNYNENFKKELFFYTKEYLLLMKEIIEYLNKYLEYKNKRKYYTIIKCIESINHIFLLTLLYTKNLSLTLYHCKKSFLYYIEFISQIGEEGNSYLQLNSKDAILFIYKKSIFDINNEYRESYEISEEDNIKMNNIKKLSTIFSIFYKFIINNIVYKNDETLKNVNANIIKVIELINKKRTDKNNLFDKVIKILSILELNNIENNKYIELLKSIIRRKKFLNKNIEGIKKSLNKKKTLLSLNLLNFKQFINYLVE